jgi:hypothetical protein
MDALQPYLDECSCASLQAAAADCTRGLQCMCKVDYADITVMDMLHLLLALARLTSKMTGQPPSLPSHSKTQWQ